MKKIVLTTLVGMLSLASVSSYATESLLTINNATQHANYSNNGQGKQAADTNLYPDPRVNNK